MSGRTTNVAGEEVESECDARLSPPRCLARVTDPEAPGEVRSKRRVKMRYWPAAAQS